MGVKEKGKSDVFDIQAKGQAFIFGVVVFGCVSVSVSSSMPLVIVIV